NYTAAFVNAQLQAVSAAAGGGAAGAQAAANYAPMYWVRSSYLQAALDQVTASYGSMQAYLTQGLGLSQADIYVLRAKMVDYLTLPGQSRFAANAASGAAFLNALQNSPLSGRYTAYNYYLQSAIDAGTLGGVETQVGGQVHADAASYLSREPLRVDAAIAPYASGRDLGEGRTRIWLAGLGGYLDSGGRSGVADSTEHDAGTVIGATHRIDDRASAYLAIGGDWGSVGSAGAHADVTTVLAAVGARYGFSTLDAGPYVAARADVAWVGYDSRRALRGGLGSATGNTSGAVYGGRADLGDVIRLAPVTITPQTGFRIAHVSLGGFNESGSDLALSVNGIGHTSSSLLTDLDVSLDAGGLDGWSIAPDANLGLELALGHPQVESTGSLDGFTVSEVSAYNSRYLVKGGLGITAERDAFTVKAAVNAVHGAGSTGIGAQLSVARTF
ncbi:MAG TPA: autotransporter domain-containing protein, partial [Stellaceae bacterium]|nr:autotransporter domain-containing protein [Stellaceae bacterium]